ncbi:MAG: HGGxSTG domain-containing protein [Candidatus Babeliales bacterium]
MPINESVRLCGAKARQNNYQPCRQPAMRGKKRCRLHGGKSTGPVTQEGKDLAAVANLKHGFYTKGMNAEKKYMRIMMRWRHENGDIRD